MDRVDWICLTLGKEKNLWSGGHRSKVSGTDEVIQ